MTGNAEVQVRINTVYIRSHTRYDHTLSRKIYCKPHTVYRVWTNMFFTATARVVIVLTYNVYRRLFLYLNDLVYSCVVLNTIIGFFFSTRLIDAVIDSQPSVSTQYLFDLISFCFESHPIHLANAAFTT